MPDARVNAWLAAWKILGGINVAQQKNTITYDQVELQMEQARIFTDLARSPQDVGVTAGEVLVSEANQLVAHREEKKRLLERVDAVAEDWIGKATTTGKED